ncbi:MAG: NfeD family protein [Ignavibacteriales bacterium]
MSPALVWVLIGIAAGIIEVFTLGLWFLWLSLAGLLVSLGAKLHILNTWGAQIFTFAILTIFFIFVTRPLVMKVFKTKDVKSNVDSLIGATGLVIQDIAPLHTGQIKLYGEVWTATADQEITTGSEVVILSVEGVKLKVEVKK